MKTVGAEYYNVTDFYRLRYSEDRIRLLDFEQVRRTGI